MIDGHVLSICTGILCDFRTLIIKDQRICIKFCVKNEIKCSEVVRMLKKAFGEFSMSTSRDYEWYKRFKKGGEDVDDDIRTGRPSIISDENVSKIKEIVLTNRRITIREVAEKVNISYSSCESIFRDILGFKRVSAKFVPKLLNFKQKHNRKNISEQILTEITDDSEMLKCIITRDET